MPRKRLFRRRVLTNPKLQVSLGVRIAFYWLLCLFTTSLLMRFCQWVTGSSQIAEDMQFFYRSAFYGTLAFLPLVIADVVRLGNRFSVPVERLQRAIRDLNKGQHVEPIRFRKGDFWQDLAADFNALIDRVQDQGRDQQSTASLTTTLDDAAEAESAGVGSR